MSSPDPRPFEAAHADAYAEGPPRQVPGFAGLHRMTSLLLAERVPPGGRVLVLGAGGGLELKALADDHPGWSFAGVDPSADMLRTAERIAAAHLDRIELVEGYVDAAPAGPFDGAVCLLTLHFVPREQRLHTLGELRRRLVPGAPFVAAHLSVPEAEPARSTWIDRHLAFGGTEPARRAAARETLAARLSVLSPQEDEALLRAAGFSNVELFYAGFAVRGWIAYA